MMLTDKLDKFLLNIFENECDHTVDSVFLAASDVDLPAWVLEFSKRYPCACQLWSKKHDFLLRALAEARKYCIGNERESIDALERAVRLTTPKVQRCNPWCVINLSGHSTGATGEALYRLAELPSTFPVRAAVISWVRSFRERKVKEYSVTKYNPRLRGPNDEYHRDEWISFTQIGQSFGGVVLTEEENKLIEHAQIKAALAFLGESAITALRVEGIENSRQQPLKFHEGGFSILSSYLMSWSEILREEAWCRLQANEAFVHLGWDCYMYIGPPHRCVTAEQAAIKLGLYVEEFASPYHEEAGN